MLVYRDWKTLADGLVSCNMMTAMAFSCMDIIQTVSETIVDAVLPWVYTYTRTNGTFCPTSLCVTEGQVQEYLGESIQRALTKCLKVNVQDFASTKVFSELLVRHISKRVNSVLALFTQSLNSRLPVVYVSGCLTSIKDLKDMVFQLAVILMTALDMLQKNQGVTEDPSRLIAMSTPSLETDTPVFFLFSTSDLKKLVKTYIIHMVKVLKRSQSPPCRISCSNQRDVCARVGTDTKILTVEESESQGQESTVDSVNGLSCIPGAVPDIDTSTFENSPFRSMTVIRAAEYYQSLSPTSEMELITNIADELVQTFVDLHQTGETDSGEITDLQLEEVEKQKIRQFTGRIFDLVMSGRDYYQIPLVPAETLMCDTVTYRGLENINNLDTITNDLYMRTEEVVTRCAVQVLLWLALSLQEPNRESLSVSLEDLSGDLDFFAPRDAGGDRIEADNIIHFNVPEPAELPQPQLLESVLLGSLVTQLAGEMLIIMGIRDTDLLLDLVPRIKEHLEGLGHFMYHHFYAALMGRRYEDIFQTTFTNLLQEFGSLQAMQEAVTAGDPSLEDAMIRALTKLLRFPEETPMLHERSTKKGMCCLLKKVKKWCCKERKTTTVISVTIDQEDNKLQGNLQIIIFVSLGSQNCPEQVININFIFCLR